jgi:hypothetical protein
MTLITDEKDARLAGIEVRCNVDTETKAREDRAILFDSLRAALERERWHVKLEARVYCANHLPTAKESQVMQPCPWCEVMRVYEERIALRAALAAAIAERDALREENEALAYELKCFHGGNDGDDVHYCGKCDDHVASAEEIRENISRRRADAAKGGKG